jgi:energy-coupling factor transporter ATP-binding protein EcfA2
MSELKLNTVLLSDIRPKPLRWLVPGYFPRGKIVLIAGDGGLGKSTLMLDTAAALTSGRPALGLTYEPEAICHGLLIGCEDDYEDTVVPRLLGAMADRELLAMVEGTDLGAGKTTTFSLTHIDQLNNTLTQNPEIRFIIIDPASAYLAGTDARSNAELRTLLSPLSDLAAEQDITIFLVTHLNKATNMKPVHRVLDSVAWVNVARVAYLVVQDPNDSTKRLLVHIKGNLATPPKSTAFRIGPIDALIAEQIVSTIPDMSQDDQDALKTQCVAIEWLGTVETTAEDLEENQRDTSPSDNENPEYQRTKRQEAADLIRVMLNDGPRRQTEIMTNAREMQISPRTLDRARCTLGVRSEKITDAAGTYYLWHPLATWQAGNLTSWQAPQPPTPPLFPNEQN